MGVKDDTKQPRADSNDSQEDTTQIELDNTNDPAEISHLRSQPLPNSRQAARASFMVEKYLDGLSNSPPTLISIPLFRGNLIFDVPVVDKVLSRAWVPHAPPPDRDEFTHHR